MEQAVYYWKTTPTTDTTGAAAFSHYYVRFFDVVWSPEHAQGTPVGIINVGLPARYPFYGRSITPVVYITNEVLNHNWNDAEYLANKIVDKTLQIRTALGDSASGAAPKGIISSPMRSLQIDCDWTESTREAYFRLLREIKKRLPTTELSVTIRLYPYKYAERMGVPPADRGVLMCYNLAPARNVSTVNSVFDLAELKQYIAKKKYPLPLDYALPVFGWALWFRGSDLQEILHSPDTSTWRSYGIVSANENWQVATRDTTLGTHYLRAGDRFRIEYPDASQLVAATDLLYRQVGRPQSLIFFHYEPSSLSTYAPVFQAVRDR